MKLRHNIFITALLSASVTGSVVLSLGKTWVHYMPEVQLTQHRPVRVRCRFAMTAADAHSGYEYCVFEFPGCEGCPNAMHFIQTVGSSEDPMKSMALSGWIAGAFHPKK